MAGDWIKFEKATLDKPEVLQMADTLNTTADDVVGKLLRVWCWFDDQSRNGDAGGVTGNALKRFIDRLVASQGFASCMEKVGWLNDAGIPNFDRHNGESAKNRALTRNRMKRKRDADVTQNTSPEKRREEKIKQPLRVVTDTFGRFWETWPSTERKVAKAKCAEVWRRRQLDALADQIIAHVVAMKEAEQWRKGFEPSPLTYLNQRRWEDDASKPRDEFRGAL